MKKLNIRHIAKLCNTMTRYSPLKTAEGGIVTDGRFMIADEAYANRVIPWLSDNDMPCVSADHVRRALSPCNLHTVEGLAYVEMPTWTSWWFPPLVDLGIKLFPNAEHKHNGNGALVFVQEGDVKMVIMGCVDNTHEHLCRNLGWKQPAALELGYDKLAKEFKRQLEAGLI